GGSRSSTRDTGRQAGNARGSGDAFDREGGRGSSHARAADRRRRVACRAGSGRNRGSTGSGRERAMKLTIGVMGASGGDLTEEVRRREYHLGEANAEYDAVLVTRACSGLPMRRRAGPGRRAVDGFDLLTYRGRGLMAEGSRACDPVSSS